MARVYAPHRSRHPRTSRSRSSSRCATATLCVLLWERAREPFRGSWSLPGGTLGRGRDARELDPPAPRDEGRRARGRPPRAARDVERPGAAPRALGARDRLPRARPARCRPARPGGHARGTRSTRCPRRRSTTASIVLAGRERLRGKLSYSNIGVRARARDVHARRAARRLRGRARLRGLGDEPQARARSGAARSSRSADGARTGRPAVARPRSSASARDRLEVTDQFAVLRPPT